RRGDAALDQRLVLGLLGICLVDEEPILLERGRALARPEIVPRQILFLDLWLLLLGRGLVVGLVFLLARLLLRGLLVFGRRFVVAAVVTFAAVFVVALVLVL